MKTCTSDEDAECLKVLCLYNPKKWSAGKCMEVCTTKTTIQIVLHLLIGLHACKTELRHKAKYINPQKNEVKKFCYSSSQPMLTILLKLQ